MRHRSKYLWSPAAAVFLVVTLLAPIVPMLAGAQGMDTVSVQLKWHHQTQFAGNYVADAKGFYRKERLLVQNRPWRIGTASPIEEVGSGAATFGITSHTEFLKAREQGAPVVAIAAIYQRSPVGFFALKASGIKHPKDFVGKAVAYAPTHEIHLKAMLKRLGLDFTALKRMPYGFDLTPFYKREVSVWGGYIMNQPVDARLTGHEISIIFPDDYGVHTYDDVVFTSEDLIRRNPSLVTRWLRATLQGWRYAIEHPEEATEITLNVDPTRRREKELAMLLASIPLIHTGQHPVGWMTRETWEEASEILLDQKILRHRLELEKAYTTRFLNEA
ncbi:MAG: ABC transporter substrate-binding protein, partial [Candidatus Rokubacteria bacterium]|nr:ABC transporter substrate-binding protein [Candidatus Rokubacteria bacterium]